MGAVYRARDVRFNNVVAVKESFFGDSALGRAFEREARLLRDLKHRGLPRVIDYFEEAGKWYLVMDYVAGDDLDAVVHRRGAPLTVEQVLSLADQLLEILEYLHGHTPAVLHRDIKPQNLKVTPAGELLLLDFGLSKGSTRDQSASLAARSVSGYTPGYAPLEQVFGLGTDPRSDLYSVGATLFFLLTGAAPADAAARNYAVHMLGQPGPLPRVDALNPAVPRPVADVVTAAMQQHVAARPQNAAAMRLLLRTASGPATAGHSVVTRAATMPATVPQRGTTHAATIAESRSRPLRKWTGIAVLVTIGLVLLGGGTFAVALYVTRYWSPASSNEGPPPGLPNTPEGKTPPTKKAIVSLSRVEAARICAGYPNWFACALAIERHQLTREEYAPYVARTGQTLSLALRDGKQKEFADRVTQDDSTIRYAFRDYFRPQGLFVMCRQFYEGGDHVVVDDRTGKAVELDAAPYLSPDGRRLLTASYDLAAGYVPNRLRVYELKGTTLLEQYSIEPMEWGPADADWLDDNTIAFDRVVLAADGAEQRSPRWLVWTGTAWSLQSTAPDAAP